MRKIPEFLKLKTSWSTIELGLLKICLVSFGIMIGVLFRNPFKEYFPVVGCIFIVTGLWAVILWIKKIRG